MLKNAGEDSGGFAVTDHGHMNSAGYFAAAQKKHKDKGMPVKLIWGLEAYYIPSIDEWNVLKVQRDAEKKEEKKRKKEEDDEGLVFENEKESKAKYFDPITRRNHLVLTAYNSKGLINLFRLVSRSHREGFYKKPRIDFRMLRDCNEGLIASTACIHPDAILRTSAGSLKMKEVVERVKSGELLYVLSYSEEEKRIVFNKITWADKTRKNAKLLKIKLKDGKELKLTPDHKVFTDKGWIEAKDLTKDHKIMSLGIPAT